MFDFFLYPPTFSSAYPQRSLAQDFVFPLVEHFKSTQFYLTLNEFMTSNVYNTEIYTQLNNYYYEYIQTFINNLLDLILQSEFYKFYLFYGTELKDLIIFFLIFINLYKLTKLILKRGFFSFFYEFIYEPLQKSFFDFLKVFLKNKIQSEIQKTQAQIEDKLVPLKHRQINSIQSLPLKGLSQDSLKQTLQKYKLLDENYTSGKVSGTVYATHLSDLLNYTYSLFSHSNPLHPDVFPSIRKMESEIISMCLNLYNAPSGCGNVTSGGTESILMAVKSHRDYYKWKTNKPEIIVPFSAHAAFDKAGAYFGVKVIHAKLKNDFSVDLRDVERLICEDTVMIVGSAVQYPHGVLDDIEGLGKLALKYGVGLHVDCCLGSFIVPFLHKIYSLKNTKVPLFDFRVKGVTSISCDTHKYGFAPKGSSVIMYSNHELRRFQYFVQPNWLGGIYASPSIAGSRSGALVASCWTAMMSMGYDGYFESASKIVECSMKIKKGVKEIDGLVVLGEPIAMVVSFSCKKSSEISENAIYNVADEMSKKGWNLNSLQYPPAVHLCCTFLTVGNEDAFLRDLRECFDVVKKNNKNKAGDKDEGMGAIYGMAASIPDKRLVVDIANGYLDALTKVF